MPRGIVDFAGLDSADARALRATEPPRNMPFRISRIGHVVLRASDIERSVAFYTLVLGFKVTDVYPESMMRGRMVFLRFNEDHHGVALVGTAEGPAAQRDMHHMAFQVETIDELFRARDHLRAQGVDIDYEGRRRAGCQISIDFRDPDGHFLEIYWGLDQVPWDGAARGPDEWVPTTSLEESIRHAPAGQDTTLADPNLMT